MFNNRNYSLLKLLSALIFFALSNKALAYPNYISYTYTSCLTCHYNPMGNGPLTDYGRAASATVISSRVVYEKTTSDETIGQDSGFLYKAPKQTWFRPSVDYRGLYLMQNVGSKTAPDPVFIQMDANLNVVMKFGKNDNIYTSLSMAYAPTPRSIKTPSGGNAKNYRSREHYIAWRPEPSWGVYLGLMDKAFGIRVSNHNSYSRLITGLGMNDQTHGVLLHYLNKKFEVAVHPFFGNLAQDADIRQVGVSTQFEYTLSQKHRTGFSFLTSKSKFLQTTLMAAHSRLTLGKGHSLLIEAGLVTKKEIIPGDEVNSKYILMQNHIRAFRGVFALFSAEFLKPNSNMTNKTMRLAPGIQYFPVQGVELRAELSNSRVFSESSVTDDQWDITGQLHLWF